MIQRSTPNLDINTVFDDDIIEWSLGLIMQLEALIAAGAYPKIRVVKKRQADAPCTAWLPWPLLSDDSVWGWAVDIDI